jgi:hypothetical protein
VCVTDKITISGGNLTKYEADIYAAKKGGRNMKKTSKRVISFILALVMILTLSTFTAPESAQASSMSIPTKVRCGVGMKNYNTTYFYVGDGNGIYKLKVNNKKLHVKQTYKNTGTGEVGLSMYADTNKVYLITFYVRNSKGRIIGSKKKIYVYAAGDGNFVKTLQVGKITSTTSESVYTTQSKVKIKLKALPGYTLKKIEVGKYSANSSTMKYTKIKNGQTITLGTCGYSYYGENSSDSGYYVSRGLLAETVLRVTYYDKFSNYPTDECTTYLYIYKRASSWAN